MRFTDRDFDALVADLDRALAELMTAARGVWTRARPGKWSAGRHAEHVAIALEATAESLERGAAGTPEAPPRRGLLQRLFVWLVLGSGRLPRGGRTPARFEPGAAPDPDAVGRRLVAAAARHRALGASAAARATLWAPNPFRPAWHYRLPEMLRMHAVHARHHAALVREIA